MAKMTFRVDFISSIQGKQNKKVFIYENDVFVEYLWMSNEDIWKNKEQIEARGDEFVFLDYVGKCTYPDCKCPFDMGTDNKCLLGKEV